MQPSFVKTEAKRKVSCYSRVPSYTQKIVACDLITFSDQDIVFSVLRLTVTEETQMLWIGLYIVNTTDMTDLERNKERKKWKKATANDPLLLKYK